MHEQRLGDSYRKSQSSTVRRSPVSVLGRNIVWLMISQLATWIATFATLLIVPDRLGSSDFGDLGFAYSYVLFFTLLAGLGTSTYLARAVARDHSLVGPYVWNAVLLKFVLASVFAALALAIALALDIRGTTFTLIAIQCGGMLLFVLTEVTTGALTGLQRMARPAMWVVVQVYFQSIVGVGVLLLGWGVIAYATVLVIGMLIPLAATALMVHPMVRGHRRLDFGIWRLLIVGGIPLVALTAFNLVYGTVNVPILFHIAGPEAVGWYTLALKWIGIPVFVTTSVVYASFPAFAEHGKPLTPHFAPLVNRTIHVVLFVTIPASLGIALVADDLIRLFYQPEFEPSIVLIQILAIQIPLAAMDTVLATALVATDRLNRYLYVAAIAAAANPLACVIAINITENRYGNGAIGAAIVMVATEAWVLVGALFLRSPGVMDRDATARVGRILLSAATMVPAVLLVRESPLVVQIAIGVVVYVVVSLVSGSTSIGELGHGLRQLSASFRPRRPDAESHGGTLDDETDIGEHQTRCLGGDLHPKP